MCTATSCTGVAALLGSVGFRLVVAGCFVWHKGKTTGGDCTQAGHWFHKASQQRAMPPTEYKQCMQLRVCCDVPLQACTCMWHGERVKSGTNNTIVQCISACANDRNWQLQQQHYKLLLMNTGFGCCCEGLRFGRFGVKTATHHPNQPTRCKMFTLQPLSSAACASCS